MDPLRASYEAVAYDSVPIPLAEPDAIAAIAALHGVTPPPPDRCRLLELGCATAGNLMSIAFRSPRSELVGVDLAPAQIETGRLAVAEMGLQNVTLEARDLTEIGDDHGRFDYIICHGVYSWVPPAVQDAILRVCERNLAPTGIAYVSYNAYPGWHHRGMVRDMLAFNDVPSLPPAQRLERARALATLLAGADPSDGSPHAAMLREEAEYILRQSDQHLFHEQLEPWNEPVYFAEFARRAATHGLRYLAEAKLPAETAATARVRGALGAGVDVVRGEQYLDFVRGRMFRRTLLCHGDTHVAPAPIPGAVRGLFARSRAISVEPAAEDAARGPGVAAFRIASGAMITTNNPVVVAALGMLTDVAPAAVSFEDLRRHVDGHLGSFDDADVRRLIGDDDALASALLQCATAGFVEFRALPSAFVPRPGPRPKASALARWQSTRVADVTSLGHSVVTLAGVERFLLPHLDGTNDRSRLVRLLASGFSSGDLRLDGGAPSPEQLSGVLDELLERMGRSALLVS